MAWSEDLVATFVVDIDNAFQQSLVCTDDDAA